MDTAKGFQLEKPDVFIPWRIRETELAPILHGHTLRHVTTGYYTISCTSLGGLEHELGFHFHPREGGVLDELECFRTAYPDLNASYRQFQRHLEESFGPPTGTSPGSEGFPSRSWRLEGLEVLHYVFDRFGPEEHVTIKVLDAA